VPDEDEKACRAVLDPLLSPQTCSWLDRKSSLESACGWDDPLRQKHCAMWSGALVCSIESVSAMPHEDMMQALWHTHITVALSQHSHTPHTSQLHATVTLASQRRTSSLRALTSRITPSISVSSSCCARRASPLHQRALLGKRRAGHEK
jgi:hypothetical protein